MFVLSDNGRVIRANQYARTLTGRDVTGQAIQDLVVDFTNTFDLSALAEDPSREHLLNISTRSGLPQTLYFSFHRVDEAILMFGRLDGEELEAMREEVLSLNHELNNLMRELHKKNAQLQRLSAEKNRFLGMAAHDLRAPIGVIIAYTDFLIQEAAPLLNSEHQGFFDTIITSCLFMKTLVDDFLDISAIEAGKFDLHLESADICHVLEKSLNLIALKARKKGIDLQVHAGDSIPRVVMDAPKIEQAVMNLVSNAVEHTEPGTAVDIGITMDPGAVTVSVQDRGPGILPEEMDNLFKPFGKTSAKKTAGEKSTGLGLLITRKIIEAHKGKLWVESQSGRGTTVSFKLPLNAGEL